MWARFTLLACWDVGAGERERKRERERETDGELKMTCRNMNKTHRKDKLVELGRHSIPQVEARGPLRENPAKAGSPGFRPAPGSDFMSLFAYPTRGHPSRRLLE